MQETLNPPVPAPTPAILPPAETPRLGHWVMMGLIVLVGMAIRVAAFVHQGSLHMDEASVARNILERTYLGLAAPLDYVQASPLMHLWLTKLSIGIFGLGEWQLRLPAMIAGVIAMGLFGILAMRILRPKPALLAAGLFALLSGTIYYGAFTKSYTFDIVVALAMVLAGLEWRRRQDRLHLAILAVAGMAACWFSYAAPMVLGGVGIALGLEQLRRRQWKQLGSLLACGALWLGSFAIVWFAIAGKSAQDPGLHEFWKNAFVPLFPQSGKDVGTIVWHYFHLFESPFLSPYAHPRADLTPYVAGLVAAFCLVGAGELWHRNRAALLMLILPVALTLVASSMHRYPFRWRFLLFLSPAIIITAAYGMQVLGAWAILQRRRVLAVALPSVILLIAAANTAQLFLPYFQPSGMHAMLIDLSHQVHPGDTVIVHDQSQISFDFYQRFFPECRLEGVKVIPGAPSTHLTQRVADADVAVGQKRVWYVYENEWTFYPDFFPELGIWSALAEHDGAAEVDKVRAAGTVAALYDFSSGAGAAADTRDPAP